MVGKGIRLDITGFGVASQGKVEAAEGESPPSLAEIQSLGGLEVERFLWSVQNRNGGLATSS